MGTLIDWKNPDYASVYSQRIERIKRLRDNPALLPSVREYYKDHPADFINDLGMTFDPRLPEVGLPATVPFLLFPKQREFIDYLHRKWLSRQDGLAEKSRDMGVSWLCVGFACWMLLFHPGTVVGFGSRKEEYVDKIGDPKSLFWKARKFIELLPKEFRPAKWESPHMRILNADNGAAIVGEAGDNIGRGNRTSIYFKDESAFYEHAEAIDAALSQTSNCKIDVSTPNGSGNPFYRKRHGGKIEVFTFHWKDDPRKDDVWYAKQKETLDPSIVAQEIDINYEASITDAYISGESVVEAMGRDVRHARPQGGLMVGVDVARFGDDLSVVTFRRGRVYLARHEMQGQDVVSVAGRVRAEIEAYRERPAQIAVDTIGIGAGVADMLRQWYGPLVQDVNSAERMSDGNHYNRRAYMWSEMREWVKTAVLPNDPDLKSELTALRYKFKGGELLIESKDDAKRRGIKSPDRADSLAMTFAHPPMDFYDDTPIHQNVATV